ncbi:MAG: anaerobic carbon-monoxide dehydrogenase catalytic subunit [Armatimonadota bacterium]|nr:anaerobic carbon-monoxide dehydrogenase catalytic subunit [Armatimonadota bacterium]
MAERKERTDDKFDEQMLDTESGVNKYRDRYEAMRSQCSLGMQETCCQICNMGPCKINPQENGPDIGVCGANADTIGAWNLARMIAAGAAVRSEYCRDMANLLLKSANNQAGGFKIKDAQELFELASELGISTNGRDVNQVAADVAEVILSEIGRQDGYLRLSKRVPQKRQEIWEGLNVIPSGINSEIVQLINVISLGAGNDFRNVICRGIRTALADGWGSSMIAAKLSDILFGPPKPIRSQVNIGALCEDSVNIVFCGDALALAEMIATAADDPELTQLAMEKGAKNIRIAGMCSAGNEILMQHGFPVIGDFLAQESAILTGLVDAIVVDTHCAMPALDELVRRYHTKLITTSSKCRFQGGMHIPFDLGSPLETAKQIIREAVESYANRNKSQMKLPDSAVGYRFIAGFTPENLYRVLGGTYRGTCGPLNNAIIEGRIRGIAAVIGCSNPKIGERNNCVEITKELIKNDILVIQGGCAAIECARAGLLAPEGAQYAGLGLREFCEVVGIPPVLHFGSCMDCSRALVFFCNMLSEGNVGEDLSDIPIALAIPEWTSGSLITVSFYMVASGILSVFGMPFQTSDSQNLNSYLCSGIEEDFGGRFAFEVDPIKTAHLMIDHINMKRKSL